LFVGAVKPSHFQVTNPLPVRPNTARAAAGKAVRSLARPDEWAIEMLLMVDGRNFTLERGEYVRQVIRDNSPEIVIPKAAQMRFTVTMLTKALHAVALRGWNVLYLLPLKTGAVPFVQGRIDPIIESNPELAEQFKAVDNRLHKQSAKKFNLYIRGTNIKNELQEVPVDFEVWDERDRMVEENLGDARHRMDGSKVKKLVMLSTPTVEGHGIYSDDAWDISDQHRWEVPCPGCNRFQSLNYDDKALDYSNLRIGNDRNDCVLECAYCKRRFTDEERPFLNALGRWSPHNPDGELRGYHINQFNSPTQTLPEIMRDYFKGQREVKYLKAFWNQSMGQPFTSAGDRFTVELLDKCRERYDIGGIPASYLQVGIDVGTMIHVWCWTKVRDVRRLWQVKIFQNFDQLHKWLSSLPQWVGVIDAHPEKSKSRELCLAFPGRLYMGFEQDRDQQGEIAHFSPVKYKEAPEVKIDRTLAFDTVIGEFMHGHARLPSNARELGEHLPRKDYNGVYAHMIQQARVEEENVRGILIARWKRNRNPDHWHHACMFATIAGLTVPPLLVPGGFSSTMNKNLIASR
jgi:hypothetical protein